MGGGLRWAKAPYWSSCYYVPIRKSPANLTLMRRLDEQYMQARFYSVERMTAWLRQQGYAVNPKRVRRLLRLIGLEAIHPKPRLSLAEVEEKRYPSLPREPTITVVNEV